MGKFKQREKLINVIKAILLVSETPQYLSSFKTFALQQYMYHLHIVQKITNLIYISLNIFHNVS